MAKVVLKGHIIIPKTNRQVVLDVPNTLADA